jgi:Spy/CpxP family protein refolding chaperone
MTRLKLIILVALVLSFGAGTLVGMGRARVHPGDRPGFEELNLSSDQERQMREIWSGLMERAPERFGQRRAIEDRYRGEALALLTPDQRTRYDELEKKLSQELEVLDAQREALFTDAVNRTRAVLTPDQAAKYDEMIRQHRPPGPGHGPRGDGPGGKHGGPPMPSLLGPRGPMGPGHGPGGPGRMRGGPWREDGKGAPPGTKPVGDM